ncbi:predicted protein [Coccidioides posadasii str. Silveira]|uniref:Predicted protein n=2 Tax=Coccidioides posadasii TaxID=199306 RepID=E9D9B6_COCPS|nr:predicted protein [Coccidioides posadasii str. Silveira]KMM70062.1 hypothetical protein CPAG_06374 [Coccidioides posadasii RMSCC 3488]
MQYRATKIRQFGCMIQQKNEYLPSFAWCFGGWQPFLKSSSLPKMLKKEGGCKIDHNSRSKRPVAHHLRPGHGVEERGHISKRPTISRQLQSPKHRGILSPTREISK